MTFNMTFSLIWSKLDGCPSTNNAAFPPKNVILTERQQRESLLCVFMDLMHKCANWSGYTVCSWYNGGDKGYDYFLLVIIDVSWSAQVTALLPWDFRDGNNGGCHETLDNSWGEAVNLLQWLLISLHMPSGPALE